ncbi:TPA: M23 family metallopeptidase [Acinetobacter baumannii]
MITLGSTKLRLLVLMMSAAVIADLHASATNFEYAKPSGQTGKPSNLDAGDFPLTGNLLVTSRFGITRFRSDGSPRSHSGLDIINSNGNHSLYAIADGVVIANGWMTGGGNYIRVKRKENNDVYQYLHLATRSPLNIGTEVKKGQYLGTMGNTGISFGTHLHFDYAIPQKEGSRARNAWLGSPKGSANANPYQNIQTIGLSKNGIEGYYVTDPTPYLKDDIKITDSTYKNYLGSTIRQQFNILYGANLPVGAGATQPKFAGVQFKLPQGYGATDEQLAKVNISVIEARQKALENGEITEAQAYDPNITYREVEDIFKDSGQVGSSEETKLDIGDDGSVKGHIENLAFKRFASAGWAQDLVKASNRSLWVEFLNIEIAKNHLKTQLLKQNERIEALLAAYAIAKARVLQGKIEELRQAIENGRNIALISRLELEDLPPIASDTEVMNATVTKRNGSYGLTGDKKAAIIAVAQAIGANPNDLAAVISFETAGSFSPSIRNPKGSATGLIQFMQYTDGTGNDKTPRDQWDYWGMTRSQFGSLSFTEQMKYVEKYFKDRGLRESKPVSLATLYGLVMGVPKGGYTIARHSAVFRDNPAWDVNGDGVITAAEAVNGSKFKAHIRVYFPDFP